jgi:hypothetical protein
MIEFCNENSGFIMALLTLVYVIATILICWANFRSSQATKKQNELQIKMDEEDNRARIIPYRKILENNLVCLCFANVGHQIASDVKISFSEEWIKQLDSLSFSRKQSFIEGMEITA